MSSEDDDHAQNPTANAVDQATRDVVNAAMAKTQDTIDGVTDKVASVVDAEADTARSLLSTTCCRMRFSTLLRSTIDCVPSGSWHRAPLRPDWSRRLHAPPGSTRAPCSDCLISPKPAGLGSLASSNQSAIVDVGGLLGAETCSTLRRVFVRVDGCD